MRSLHDRLRIAKPCTENWDAMPASASGRSRHCASCEHEVHDISAMTRADVETLLARSTARICGRFRTRGDGAVVVADGHVLPAVDPKRRLPILTALAFGLAACTTSAAPSPPEPSPSVTVAPSASTPAAPSSSTESSDAGPVRDAATEAAADAGIANDAGEKPKRKPAKPAPAMEPTEMGIFVPHGREPSRPARGPK